MNSLSRLEIVDVRVAFDNLFAEAETLWQNWTKSQGLFSSFVTERGVQITSEQLSDIYKRGWLQSDGMGRKDTPLFHPFRICPLFKISSACDLSIYPLTSLRRDRYKGFLSRVVDQLPTDEDIEDTASIYNRIVNLALLAEPVYWPDIIGVMSRTLHVGQEEFENILELHKQKLLSAVASLDLETWEKVHHQLCLDAHVADSNASLYLLLRLSSWDQRERLKGNVATALWIRHVAETIRRAFEDAHCVKWREEDNIIGIWPRTSRKLLLGSERPLDPDQQITSKRYVAWEYGLFTGSVVRWYVEGNTEYFAILELLEDPSVDGIELVNLRGALVSKDNMALKLRDGLRADREHRRFSLITFDADVPDNVKFIQKQIADDNVVGSIMVNDPDFEFANFSIQELIEIAAGIEEKEGGVGDAIRNGDWSNIKSGRDFSTRFSRISTVISKSIKGEVWGRALAVYASENPYRRDTGKERPFLGGIRAALMARIATYDLQHERTTFDSKTFALIDRPTAPEN